MKDIKCPLCGGKPEYIEFECEDGEYDLIQCNCGLCTPAGSYPNGEENCWKDWEKLVSKFPPIMRVQERDIIEYEEMCDGDILNGRVTLKTVSSRGETMLQVVIIDEDGNDYLDFNGKPEIDTIYSFQIRKWPWELEQKGGEEQ